MEKTVTSCVGTESARTARGDPPIEPRCFTGAAQPLRCGGLSPCGRFLVAGSADGSLLVWDTEDGRLRSVLTGHRGAIEALAFEDQGVLLASAARDGTIRIWDFVNGRCCYLVQGHRFPIQALDYSPSGDQIASGDADGTIKVWDVRPPRARNLFKEMNVAICGITFDPTATRLQSGDANGHVRFWDLDGKLCIGISNGHDGTVSAWTRTPDRRLSISGGTDGRVRLWDLRERRCLQTIPFGKRAVIGLAIDPAGTRIAALDPTGRVQVASTSPSREADELISLKIPPIRDGATVEAGMNANGSLLTVVGPDRAARIWDLS